MSELHDFPLVVCLCPTYGRPPHLLANTIQCFLDQDYPTDRRALLMFDDLGNLSLAPELHALGVNLVSTEDRSPSLPAKYNAMRKMLPGADIQLVWEDDEIYLPHHITSYATAMIGKKWAYPSEVWSTCTGTPEIEKSGGRFHASLGFRSWFLDSFGGWLETDLPVFDQRLIDLSTFHANPGRPNNGPNQIPSYVFRWGDTLAAHGQHTMQQGGEWYRAAKPQHTDRVHLTLEDIRHDDAAKQTIAEILSIQAAEAAGSELASSSDDTATA